MTYLVSLTVHTIEFQYAMGSVGGILTTFSFFENNEIELENINVYKCCVVSTKYCIYRIISPSKNNKKRLKFYLLKLHFQFWLLFFLKITLIF